MKVIKRLDAVLLATPYQWLVNTFQRPGAWWMEHCAIGILLAAAVTFVNEEAGALRVIGLFFDLIVVAFIALSAHSQGWMEAYRRLFSESIRPLLLTVFIIVVAQDVFLLALDEANRAYLAARVLRQVMFMSCWYFAFCTPPIPPRRRHSKLEFSA